MYKALELDVGGRLIRGMLRAPDTQGPFPTVIFFHGFTVDKVGKMRLHELFARACVKAGFACVRFDFYGCGESEGDFSEATRPPMLWPERYRLSLSQKSCVRHQR